MVWSNEIHDLSDTLVPFSSYKYLKVHIALGVQVKEQKINYGARKSLEEKTYVTRPLSMPSALSLPPLEGPNSGILVIEDEEAE